MTATAAIAGYPRWREVLEARWRDRLSEVTELSLAFHDAAAAAPDRMLAQPESGLRRLMDEAISARKALADTDEALARLAAGRFGRCEQCAAAIPPGSLHRQPEERYCPRCADDGALAVTP